MTVTARRRVRDIYPLTAMQQGMLVHALRAAEAPVYQQQFVLAVTGVPAEAALRAGLDDLVARHTVLRTGFVWEGVDTPVQVVFADAAPGLAVTDARGSDVDAAVRAALADQWATPFDLRRAPLLRAHALRVGADEWRLVTTIHHLVLDGWSMPTVQAELAELVAARLAGRTATLPPAAPFREFVTWLRDHDTTEAAGAHFKRLLGDLRHPTPLGVDRVSRVSAEPGPSGRVELFLRCDPERRPDVLARRRGLLPSTIAHAAWGLLLARCASTPDAVFGTTVSGRPAELPGVTERVGMFVNTVPVRVAIADTDGELVVDRWLAALQEQLIAGRAFEHLPVAAAQRCSAVPMGEPLYESVLGFQNYFVDEPTGEPAGPVTVRALRQQEQTGLPLVVSVALPRGATWVRVEFDERRIDRSVAEWLADRYARLLGELAAAEDGMPLRDIPLLAPAEAAPVRTRPATGLPAYPPAGAAAGQLRAAGVGAGDRVVLWLPASVDLVAAALGALALGADVGQLPSGASATELAEHCGGAAALVVPSGTELTIPPPASVVYFGQSEVDDRLPDLSGWWRGAPVGTLAEAVAVASELPFAAGEPAVLALGPDEPALLPVALAALRAGARLDFRDPLAPGPLGAGVVVGWEVPGAWRVHGTDATGGAYACVPPAGTDLGAVPGGWLADSAGRPVPDAVAGELVVTGAGGDVRTGVWARRRADGTVQRLGERPGSEDVWVAGQLGRDEAVAAAVVMGERAWIVAPDGRPVDVPALLGRLRHRVPSALLPGDVRQLAELPLTAAGHVDVAALLGPGPAGVRTEPRPLAARLAALPERRRGEFLAGLRAAQRAAPPIRPGRIRGPVPRSVQQEFYDDTAASALRPLSESTVDDPDAPDAGTALRYADYAGWQADPRRTGERDRQAAHWKTVLRGAPASGIPADRVAPDAPARGQISLTVPETATPEQWFAALAQVLARCGRDDDVVLGVVTRPVLPPELDGVPGPFSRMLPVRVAVGAGDGPAAVTEAVGEALATARCDADLPWPRLRAMLAEDPLVSVAVHDRPGALAAHAAATVGLDIGPDAAGGTGITAVFDGRAITEHTVTGLIRRAARAVSLARTEPNRPIDAADLVTGAERDELLRAADGGAVADPPATVPELVARQDLDAVAVVAADGELTYRQLLDRAAGLAAELRARGVGVEHRVAVCLPRTAATVWAPLGIMLAGAAYVPVDPKYPPARIEYLCADAGVSTVVTNAGLAGRFPAGIPVLNPDPLPERPFEPVAPGRPDSADHTAAYVIYTSGSTGRPKGVLVEHRAVVDFSRHIARAYRIGPDTRLLGFAALTFDVSVFDLWSALCSGATLVLAGDEERLSVEALRRLLVEQRVTVAELPPGLMPLLDPAELPDLRLVSVGGEAPAGVLVDEWATGGREFWNGYGPAEATVAVTLMRCRPPSGGRTPPIGLPMPNHRAYVLDERLRPVPAGVPGELCVAGAGLARGYLGRPGHTADRFVPDPFGDEPGSRLYRTGDLARWATVPMLDPASRSSVSMLDPASRSSVVLEFLGRVDRQVKIRGFRVELGEVESVLAADERIRQVAVEVWEGGDAGRHLTAYVVPASTAPTLAEVREIAAARLPDYMVPTRLAVLAELPRTPSGKIDRRALPAPPEPAAAADDAAWTDLERAIATDVLGPLLSLSTVDRRADFFELGGNSLQATQVTARVRDRLGAEIALADFLAEPTVARLATLVEQERHRAAERQDQVYDDRPAPRMTPGTVLPQSFPQQALFRTEERYGHDPRYNAPFALRMCGRLDLDALRRAFALVVRRHPTLRVSLHRDGDDYVQRVLAVRDIPLEVSDVAGADLDERLRTVRRLVREEGARAFDLATGPPIRVRVHRLGEDDHVVQWTVHHVAIDGWSIGILLHELGTAYHAYAEGTEPDLEPLDGDYAEFVQWHRDYVAGSRYAEDLTDWRDRLRGLGGIGLPTPVERRGHAFRPGYLNLTIGPDLAAAVAELGRRNGTSLYMTGLAAYATVLAAHSGAGEIAVVTPNSLRVRSHWERLIGWFVNRVVVRVPVAGSATFGDLLRVTREATTAAFGRQAVPFESLRAELELPDAALAACFSVQNAPVAGRAFRSSEFTMELVGEDIGIEFSPIGPVYAPHGLRYESSVVLVPQQDGTVVGGWEFDAELFDERTALRWRAGLIAVLARAAAAPDTPVRELCRLAAAS
ncbi:MAG: amino acid adenylation domain-containing protein [Actinophytocola sp.]|uniref:non-ribosomal peptide synthetase n=1 Tax=Actinophytocola sp. TaxID=1872138 RepID=UPI00132C2DD6|nr:non-ribosomal peptide synthetase [Actinophytocola sp.]MPZ81610.1 amino acid adenylation domain-containing protein [Actinophytocola sp.]